MSSSREADSDQSVGVLSAVVGDNSRARVLDYLSQRDGSVLQMTIADDLDVSEAAVSRAKKDLVESGVVKETNEGLQTPDGVDDAVESFRNALE